MTKMRGTYTKPYKVPTNLQKTCRNISCLLEKETKQSIRIKTVNYELAHAMKRNPHAISFSPKMAAHVRGLCQQISMRGRKTAPIVTWGRIIVVGANPTIVPVQ